MEALGFDSDEDAAAGPPQVGAVTPAAAADTTTPEPTAVTPAVAATPEEPPSGDALIQFSPATPEVARAVPPASPGRVAQLAALHAEKAKSDRISSPSYAAKADMYKKIARNAQQQQAQQVPEATALAAAAQQTADKIVRIAELEAAQRKNEQELEQSKRCALRPHHSPARPTGRPTGTVIRSDGPTPHCRTIETLTAKNESLASKVEAETEARQTTATAEEESRARCASLEQLVAQLQV